MWFWNLLLSCAGIWKTEKETRLKKNTSERKEIIIFGILWFDDDSHDMNVGEIMERAAASFLRKSAGSDKIEWVIASH